MSDRKEYEMTQAQYDRIMEACKPQMYLVANGTEPDVRGSILRAWDALGDELGFIGSTALPVDGKSHRFISAVPK